MSDNPEIASLTRWLADLQRQVRDLAIGNPLNKGAIQDASGRFVPLSQLAFGQVAARDSSQISLTTNSPTWVVTGPQLDVYVQSGRLRLDVAGWLIVGGLNLRLSMSYAVNGPSDRANGAGPQVVGPSELRALALESKGNAISYQMAAGFPDLVEGLAPGWYRVRGAYQLVGEVNYPEDTFGYVINRRIFATPF